MAILQAAPLVLFVARMSGQGGPAQTQEFQAERQKADKRFVSGRAPDTLPLYEDLEKRDPNHAVFAERHAAG